MSRSLPSPICPRCSNPHFSDEPCWDVPIEDDEESYSDERQRKEDRMGDRQHDRWTSEDN